MQCVHVLVHVQDNHKAMQKRPVGAIANDVSFDVLAMALQLRKSRIELAIEVG